MPLARSETGVQPDHPSHCHHSLPPSCAGYRRWPPGEVRGSSMQSTRVNLLAALALFGAGTSAANAGVVRVATPSHFTQILAASPIGQTFTAEDAQIQAIGFFLSDFNPQFAPGDHSVTVHLFDAASGGTLVASRSI